MSFVDAITDFVFVDDDISPCDIILVPGGSHPQLAEKAAELYHQSMATYILFSGRANSSIPKFPSEADYLKSLTVSLGVPPDRVICETKAAHTFENAEFSLATIEQMKIKAKKAILVCKAFHSRRVLSTYQLVFPKDTTFLVASVTDKMGLCKQNWATKQEYIDKVMSEVEKLSKYFKDKL
jgi:uncharacterized SAM-binding protein YcdF (DUF218 family)